MRAHLSLVFLLAAGCSSGEAATADGGTDATTDASDSDTGPTCGGDRPGEGDVCSPGVACNSGLDCFYPQGCASPKGTCQRWKYCADTARLDSFCSCAGDTMNEPTKPWSFEGTCEAGVPDAPGG